VLFSIAHFQSLYKASSSHVSNAGIDIWVKLALKEHYNKVYEMQLKDLIHYHLLMMENMQDN